MNSATRRPADCRDAAAWLNDDCACVSVDQAALRAALAVGTESSWPAVDWAGTHRNLFSHSAVFVAQAHLETMAELVAVLERLCRMEAWRERVLAHAPAIAGHVPKNPGVFLGYDFHLGPDGPRLIEINTNAGGGLLNARLQRAQRECCALTLPLDPLPMLNDDEIVAMFRREWRLARGDRPLGRIAIVDADPRGQFLQPEFELFRRLFVDAGIDAVIADPHELVFDGRALLCAGQPVDLVYNRLTDFALDEPAQTALRAAWLDDAVVLTPHPHAHALYADKRNLVLLGDDAWLAAIGVSEADRALLRSIVPHTEEVTADNAARFWAERRKWFFKPAGGYGSKAAYRGDKLTRRVFEEIAEGGYVAQETVAPSERRMIVDGVEARLKLDLRNYAYDGRVQLVSARLYQGQTTNFRTAGGGFAAVFPVPCALAAGGAMPCAGAAPVTATGIG